MKYIVGVITDNGTRKVRLEGLLKNGKPSGKFRDYDEYDTADCNIYPSETGQLIIETPERDKEAPKDDKKVE